MHAERKSERERENGRRYRGNDGWQEREAKLLLLATSAGTRLRPRTISIASHPNSCTMARPHPLSRSILPTAGPSSLSSQAYDPTPSSPSAAPFARHHARPLKRSRLNPAAAASSATAPSLGSEAVRKSAPAPPAVDFTAAQASGALQRVIASALAEAGFDGAQADVLWAVEDQVVSCQSSHSHCQAAR